MRQVYKGLLAVSIGVALWLGITHLRGPHWGGSTPVRSEVHPGGGNTYQMVTGDDSEEDRSRWDALYNSKNYLFGKEPAEFLVQHVNQLPVGRALDIAMGEGRNAVYLAKKGYAVTGVDISEVGLRKARRLARENNVSIHTVNADLVTYSIRENYYDVIVNINYLQRNLVPRIRAGLKPGGVVVFENHTVEQLKNPEGQALPREYLLELGELKRMFEGFDILYYQESNDGRKAVASLVARKPKVR